MPVHIHKENGSVEIVSFEEYDRRLSEGLGLRDVCKFLTTSIAVLRTDQEDNDKLADALYHLRKAAGLISDVDGRRRSNAVPGAFVEVEEPTLPVRRRG